MCARAMTSLHQNEMIQYMHGAQLLLHRWADSQTGHFLSSFAAHSQGTVVLLALQLYSSSNIPLRMYMFECFFLGKKLFCLSGQEAEIFRFFMIQDFVKPHKISAFYLDKQKSFVPKKKQGVSPIETCFCSRLCTQLMLDFGSGL